MTLDEFLIIACLVLSVVAYGGYWYFSWNVWLRYSNKNAAPELEPPEAAQMKNHH